MVIMGIMGYRERTSFLAGLTVAQISEFSLIIIFLGNKIGHLSTEIVTLITVVGIITFTFSTYMIVFGNKLYLFLAPFLSLFERKHTKKDEIELSSRISIIQSMVDFPHAGAPLADVEAGQVHGGASF